MFSNEFFRTDLSHNRKLLLDHAKKLEDIYLEKEKDLNEKRADWRNLSEEERYEVMDGIGSDVEKPKPYFDAIPCPYFMHVKDADHYSYISSDISFQNILKYTDPRAGNLRYNSPEIRELIIDGDKVEINLLSDDINTTEESPTTNGSDEKVSSESDANITPEVQVTKTTELYDKNRATIGPDDVSATLLQEQDLIMRRPKNENTLITGPAGSGKTNVLLHRMAYLVSEEHLNVKSIALFCFNVGLKKYLEQSVKKIVGREGIVVSFDKWRDDLYLETFISITDIMYDNKKKLGSEEDVKNFVKQLNDNYSSKILMNEVITLFSGRGLLDHKRKIDFSKNWKDISAEFSVIQCLMVCGNSLVESFQNKDQEIKKAAESAFSLITKEFVGFDFEKKKFNSKVLLSLWNSLHKDSPIGYEDLESPDIRSQLLYITKELSKIFPKKLFIDWERRKMIETSFTNSEGKQETVKKFQTQKVEIFQNYEHVLVDEFQDFPHHNIMLIKSFSNQGITIAGDITQSIFLEPRTGANNFPFPIDKEFKLSVTHRGTSETIRFANAVLHIDNFNYDKSQKCTQRGDVPIVYQLSSKQKFVNLVKDFIQNYPTSTFLVTAHTNKDCTNLVEMFHEMDLPEAYIANGRYWDFEKNLHVANYQQVKGLEFDFIFLTGMADFLKKSYISNRENILYTVLTRAKQRVIILQNGEKEIEDMLKGISPDLYEVQLY